MIGGSYAIPPAEQAFVEPLDDPQYSIPLARPQGQFSPVAPQQSGTVFSFRKTLTPKKAGTFNLIWYAFDKYSNAWLSVEEQVVVKAGPVDGTPPTTPPPTTTPPVTTPAPLPDRPPITIVPNQADVPSGGDNAPSTGFCGAEKRVSTQICNSLHPAVAMDGSGNINEVWHDTRDGNSEIYTKFISSKIDERQIKLLSGAAFDPATGKAFNLSCTAFTGTEPTSSTSSVLVTQSGGRMDVNNNSLTQVLTAAGGSIDFQTAGVTAGSAVSILNGENSGKTFYVSRLLAPTVAELNYVVGTKNDTGFVYSISRANSGLSSAEVRLSCNKTSSLFPDVIADSQGRFHVVYQDNTNGNFELYYVQMYPENVGKAKCVGANAPVTAVNFGPVAPGSAGSTTITSQPKDPATGLPDLTKPSTTVSFPATGASDVFFAFGNKLLPDPVPLTDGPVNDRIGLHRIFRDFVGGSGEFTGVSKVADRAAWDAQALAQDITVEPDYIAPAGHPFAIEGDFGTKFTFKNLAFITQAPPDKSVEITAISLPLRPKCLPDTSATAFSPDVTNLISAPKKPVPPGFQDPVDLSAVLSSPLASIDQDVPPRFTIDGDTSGTIFTNILTDNGRGELSRFVFNCSSDHKPKEPPRFILGQRRCGSELCAFQIGAKVGPPAPSRSGQYKITLQIWAGPDYRFLEDQISSAQIENCEKVFEKEFGFDPGDTITTFNINRGELKMDDGRLFFVVPIAGQGVEFFVEGLGVGHDIWSTDSNGSFVQYYVPFTVQPNAGLAAPMYYEGFLQAATSGVTLGPPGPNGSPVALPSCGKLATDATIDCDIATPLTSHLDIAYQRLPGSVGFNAPLLLAGDPGYAAAIALPIDVSYLQPATANIPFETLHFVPKSTVIVQKFTLTARQTIKFITLFASVNGNSNTKITLQVIKAADFDKAVAGLTYTVLGTDTQPASSSQIKFQPCKQLDAGDYAFVIKPTGDVSIGIIKQETTTALPTNVLESSIADTPETVVPEIIYQPTLYIQRRWQISTGYTVPELRSLVRFNVDLSNSAPPPPTIPPTSTGTSGNETSTSAFAISTPNGPDVISINSTSVNFASSGGAGLAGALANLNNNVQSMTANAGIGFVVHLPDSVGTLRRLSTMNLDIQSSGNPILITKVKSSTTNPTYEIPDEDNIIFSQIGGDTNNIIVNKDVPSAFAVLIKAKTNATVVSGVSSILLQASGFKSGNFPPDLLATIDTYDIEGIASNGGDATWLPQRGQLPEFKLNFSAAVPVTVTPTDTGNTTGPATTNGTGNISSIIAASPIRITKSKGDSVHPRLAIDSNDNIWCVFHSNRGGNNEIYAGRYICGKWTTSALGGTDTRVSNAGANGKTASFPNVAADDAGDAHIVWQSDDTAEGNSDIFYAKTTGGGREFSATHRISASSGEAQMPDIAVSSASEISANANVSDTNLVGNGRITVVWHDNRFNNYEIMAATKQSGEWESSGQGSTDTRITQAIGDSLFPRIAADHHGNLRVVYHDRRRGRTNPWIFMSTFVAADNRWDSTAQGGSDLPITPQGTDESLHPDIAIDPVDGVYVTWHDTRFRRESPDQQEEVMSSYCPRSDSSIRYCGPITTNIEAYVSTQFDIVDCIKGRPIDITNVPQVCLSITSPGATFFRVSEDGGEFSEWTSFQPDINLDNTVLPWVLGPGSGKKNICIQVQDATTVGFPVCKSIVLQSGIPAFKIEFFRDEEFTVPLDTFNKHPVAPAGDVFVRLTSSTPLISAPTFDVISRGSRLVFNQKTLAVSGFFGANDQGLGSFAGDIVANTAGNEFSAFGSTMFKGRFSVHRDDGFFHADGLARIIPHGKSARGEVF